MNSDGRRYYQELKTLIPSGGKYEKKFLRDIYNNLDAFLTEHPDADYSSVCADFGTPQDITVNYFENVNTEYLIRRIRIASAIRRIVTFTALIVAGTFIIRAMTAHIAFSNALSSSSNAYRTENGYVIEHIEN